MLFFTYNKPIQENKRPIDNIPDNYSPPYVGKHTTPPAKYYRKTTNCAENCGTIVKIIKVYDCNACKITRSSNTKLNKNYYVSTSEYLKARCRSYNQGLTTTNLNPETNTIEKSCCDNNNNCGIYKRSNEIYNSQGAVSSSSRLVRLKYQNIVTSAKYNDLKPLYHGETTQNTQFKVQQPVCHIRTGTKNRC